MALGLLGLVVPVLAGLLGGLAFLADFDRDPCVWAAHHVGDGAGIGLLVYYSLLLALWLAFSLPLALPALVLGLVALVKSLTRADAYGGQRAAIVAIVCGLLACVPPHVQLAAPVAIGRTIAGRLCEAKKRRHAESPQGVFEAALSAERNERAPSVVRSILDRGAGESPPPEWLCVAIDWRADAVAGWLIDHGADLQSPACSASEYPLPLARAAEAGMPGVVEHMLEHGADPNASGRATSPLAIAVTHADSRAVQALLSRGARVEDCPPNEKPLLVAATERGDPRIVSLLLRWGARAEARCSPRWGSALYAALEWDRRPETRGSADRAVATPQIPARVAVVELLLAYGADPTTQSGSMGFTPLHRAVLSNFIEGAEALLTRCDELGCAPALTEIRDRHGRTPLDLAREERDRCCGSPDEPPEESSGDKVSMIADHDRMVALLEMWDDRPTHSGAAARWRKDDP